MTRTARSIDERGLRRADLDHVWHPFTAMQSYAVENAPIVTDAEGFHLIDAGGNRYLDGISSLWCNVHGHRVPEIDEAIREQLDRVAHTTMLGLSSEPSIELARALVERVPQGLSKVFYSDSGATAVEVALKIAFQYHRQKPGGSDRRNLFVCVGGAYHGDTLGSISVGGIDLFHGMYGGLLFPTVRVPSPVAYRTPGTHDAASYVKHCFEELERVLAANGDRIVALVMEPLVQGAAGILVHPPGYLTRARELTRDHGIPLIADEVAVGFGRTGTLFACEQEAVAPDLLCLAKGITGGYLPLAATIATDEIYSAFLGEPHEGRTFFHGHTYTGNPLGCAAGLASLKLFEERDVLANVKANAAVIERKLAVLGDHPHVGEIRQKGMMIGIELVAERDTKSAYPTPLRMGHQVTLAARRRGVVLRPLGDVVVLMPAPAMPAELVERLCDVAVESIEEVTNSG